MNRICPACGSTEHFVIKEIHMKLPKDIPLPNYYSIVSCQRCGLCYANTLATQEDYDVYYSTYNNYSSQGDNQTFQMMFSPILEFIREKASKDSRMMDIGFGKGQLLKQLYSLGYTNLFGIDPSAHSVAHLREIGITAFERSVYDAADELTDTVDVAFLISVVEHFLIPKEAIISALAYLKVSGYLVVVIPDYSYCDRMILPLPSCFNQEHINYFSEESFSTMLIGTGLTLLYSNLIKLPAGDGMGDEYGRILFLQKSPAEKEIAIKKDTRTREAIRIYLDRQENQQKKVYAEISRLCGQKTPIIIWGTGAMTMSLLAETELNKCDILAFVDSNPLKQGIEFAGRTVLPPQSLYDFPDATIAISAMQHTTEIKASISSMGLQNKVIILKV